MQVFGTNPTEGQKTACVVRYGAWGDSVLVTPVLARLKADGYHVTFNCTERCYEILKADPNIDLFMLQATGEIPKDDLFRHYALLSEQFDKFVNLNGSIESTLLKAPWQPEYGWTKEERHAVCDKNYMDHTMEVAGYPEAKGLIPTLYFKKKEEEWAAKMVGNKRYFWVLVSMSGSSFHKIYPHMGQVVGAILDRIPEARVILVGEGGCKGILDKEERLKDLCGDIGIRKSFLLTKHVDLVISTETSVAMASGCWDTPKVVMLSHGSPENLTKYWANCHTITPPVSCYPCHKLHYERASCPIEPTSNLPACAALLSPKTVLDAVEKVYRAWKAKRN